MIKLGIAMIGATLMLASGPARAGETRQVFCIAVRTVPRVDQNNYVAGALGPVYVTRNFQTDLDEDQLVSLWQGFISARHPPGYAGNPTDDCHPANARRDTLNAAHGDKTVNVDWTPAKASR